jgi:hypothetical protein
VIRAASDERASVVQENNFTGSSYRGLVTDLVPGNTYFIRAMHRTSNGAETASFFARSLLVEPVLIDGPADEIGTGGVELDGGSVIAVPEGDTSTQALRVNVPAGDRSSAPDTLAMYWNTGTAGSPNYQRVGYFNEYGELRSLPSRADRVAFRVKGLATQTGNLTEWTDNSNALLSHVDPSGGANFVNLKVNETPVATDHNYTPADYGLLAWAGDPGYLAGAAAEPQPSGVLRLVKIKVPKAITVTNVVLSMKSSATLTAGQNFVALFNMAGSRLGVSTDMTATFSALTGKTTCPLMAPVVIPSGFIYAAFLLNGTVMPNMPRYGQTGDHPSMGIATPRFGTFGASLTSVPASITIGSIVTNSVYCNWAALS